MIISIHEEKGSDKIQHTFMIKTLQKVSTERIYCNTVKDKYEKHKAHVILNGENWAFPLRLEQDKTVYSFHFYPTVLEFLLMAIIKQKEIKGIQIGKEEANCHCLQITWYYT